MADDGRRPTDFSEYLREISPRGRTMLLPALLEAQERYGYISEENGAAIAEAVGAPLADVTGMIEFYSMLHAHPTGRKMIRVCASPICSLKGAHELLDRTRRSLDGDLQAGEVYLEKVECLGLCDHGPSALVDEVPIGHASPERIRDSVDDFQTQIYGTERVITQRCQSITPTSVDEYVASGGFQGLENALAMTPKEIRTMVDEPDLMGRGGAAFMTHIKWDSAASAPGHPKYIVCNADESEPGTFKDRVLLEYDPLAIVEGMVIAGRAIGSEQGYIYIRGEYSRAQEIMHQALENASRRGYLGEDILGSGLSFEIEIRSGAGAYICGEETALFESIEGKRGFPRLKPPFPTTHGLFQKPTVINNVETLANVPLILRIGPEAYRKFGSEGSPGPWLFCLSGDIQNPGLYEITQPVTLEELVFDHGGGIAEGKALRAVLLGGAAGKFVPADNLEIRLTHEDARAANLSLGSGAVTVFDEETDLKSVLVDLAYFFAHESCGKCYPCQLGTQRQLEILDRNLKGNPLQGDSARLSDVGWTMTDASICGLGQTAASAVLSALKHWPELFRS
jgi:NADH-quinone oxidoreductase subunit F